MPEKLIRSITLVKILIEKSSDTSVKEAYTYVYVCMYVCMYVYECMYTHTHTYIRIYIHAHTHTYMTYICMHIPYPQQCAGQGCPDRLKHILKTQCPSILSIQSHYIEDL